MGIYVEDRDERTSVKVKVCIDKMELAFCPVPPQDCRHTVYEGYGLSQEPKYTYLILFLFICFWNTQRFLAWTGISCITWACPSSMLYKVYGGTQWQRGKTKHSSTRLLKTLYKPRRGLEKMSGWTYPPLGLRNKGQCHPEARRLSMQI